MFRVEDHAVDRYVERVRSCPLEEARAYLAAEAPKGARIRRRTHAGDIQIRLADCILVVKTDKRYGLTVVTVLGPDEVPSLVAEDETVVNEMVQLNAMADASRHASPTLAIPVASAIVDPTFNRETLPPYVDPKSIEECEERRAKVVALHQRLAKHLGARPKPTNYKEVALDYQLVEEHVRKLRDWSRASKGQAKAAQKDTEMAAKKFGFKKGPQ